MFAHCLENSKFSGCNFTTVKMSKQQISSLFHDLSQTIFDEWDLSQMNFHEWNFAKSKIRNGNLSHCDFTKANLSYADFAGTLYVLTIRLCFCVARMQDGKFTTR